LVVEAGPACAGAAGLGEVTFHGAMRVPVVLDDREAGFASRTDGLDDVVDIFVAAGAVVDCAVEAADHQVAEREPVRLELIHPRAERVFGPRNLSAARDDVVDAELLDAARGGGDGFVRVVGRWGGVGETGLEADLRSVLALEAGTGHGGRVHGGRGGRGGAPGWEKGAGGPEWRLRPDTPASSGSPAVT